MNMKQLCAKEALKYIKDGMCIGLGGGSTIGRVSCQRGEKNNGSNSI